MSVFSHNTSCLARFRLITNRSYSQTTPKSSSKGTKRKRSSPLCGSNKENQNPTDDIDRPAKTLRKTRADREADAAIFELRQSHRQAETALIQAIKVVHEACETAVSAIQHLEEVRD